MSDAKTRPSQATKLAAIKGWDYETDVAVVGLGGAGCCAALEACDAGAEVMVFEQASAGGGSTELSSAEIYMGGNGGTRVQQACGYDDSSENMKNFLMKSFEGYADEAKVDAYVNGSLDHFNWLVDKGVPFKDSELKERAIMALTDDCLLYTGNEKAWPYRNHAQPVPRGHNLYVEGDNGGPLLIKTLMENIKQRAIDIHYETRALSLIVDEHNAVVGVVIRENQEEKTVRAKRGVVLCAGGFVMNAEMLQKYAPQFAREGHMPIGNPGDTGSGIMMGQSVGAAAINMDQCFVSIPFYPPSSLTYGIFVNDKGQRFINEDCYHGRVGYHALQQPGERIYLILDTDTYGDYEKFNYLMAEVVGTGDTAEELEAEVGLPEGTLVNTLGIYNSNAAKGEDPVFHKSPAWLKALQPPLVALDCTINRGTFYPTFTLGGLDSLPSGEVLDGDRQPITGLYAAGRTTAGIPRTAAGYGSGMSVGDATFFGRMAGKAAATRDAN